MKKAFKVIFAILLCVFLVIGTAVAIVFGITYEKDNSNNTALVVSDYDINEFVNNMCYDALNDAYETNVVSFEVDENDITYLIKAIINSLSENNLINKLELTSLDVDIDGNFYKVYINAKKGFYHTSIKLGIYIIYNENYLTLKFSELSFGKLTLYNTVKLLSDNTDEKTFKESLEENGIYCDINLENMEIIMSKDNIIKTLESSLDDDVSFITVITDFLLNNNNVFELNTLDAFKLALHLNRLKYEGYQTSDYILTTNKQIKYLLNNEYIEKENVNIYYNYILNGYESLTNIKEKYLVSSKDFSCIGIEDTKEYEGLITHSDISLSKAIGDSFTSSLLSFLVNGEITLDIKDSLLMEILNSLDVIGLSTCFVNYTTNDIAYIVIDKINIKCHDDQIYLDLIVNVNGCPIYANCLLNTNECEGLAIKGTIESLNLGDVALNNNEKEDLLKYLDYCLKEVDWIKIDSTETIIFDFEKALLSSESFKKLDRNIYNTITNNKKTLTTTKIVEGKVEITFKLISIL